MGRRVQQPIDHAVTGRTLHDMSGIQPPQTGRSPIDLPRQPQSTSKRHLPTALVAGLQPSKVPPPLPSQLVGLEVLPHTPKPLRSILKKPPPPPITLPRPFNPQLPQTPSSARNNTDDLWGVASAAAGPSKPKPRLKSMVKKFIRQDSLKSVPVLSPNDNLIAAGFLNSPTSVVAPPPTPQTPLPNPRIALQKLRFVESITVIPRPETDSDPYDDEELEGFELPPSPTRGSLIWEKGKELELDTAILSTSPSSSSSISSPWSIVDSPASYMNPLSSSRANYAGGGRPQETTAKLIPHVGAVSSPREWRTAPTGKS